MNHKIRYVYMGIMLFIFPNYLYNQTGENKKLIDQTRLLREKNINMLDMMLEKSNQDLMMNNQVKENCRETLRLCSKIQLYLDEKLILNSLTAAFVIGSCIASYWSSKLNQNSKHPEILDSLSTNNEKEDSEENDNDNPEQNDVKMNSVI